MGAPGQNKRSYGKQPRRLQDDGSSSDDGSTSDEELATPEGPGGTKTFKDLNVVVPSLRFDSILKAGLGLSRRVIEEALYSHQLQHNGCMVAKKSAQVTPGDVLELLDEGGNHVVSRVLLNSVDEKKTISGAFRVSLRRWKRIQQHEYE
uniref:mitochondrial transcription rescue factor 1 n=1 Tax=Myxine glutinosa TaxID=7769 RepID=UPI00358F5204